MALLAVLMGRCLLRGWLPAPGAERRPAGEWNEMPKRPSSPCSRPGCPHRKPCPVHTQKRAPDTRPSSAARGYDRTWRQIRAAFLKKHPDCLVCGQPAEEVDHIIPL